VMNIHDRVERTEQKEVRLPLSLSLANSGRGVPGDGSTTAWVRCSTPPSRNAEFF
jgi:hypothetical protein